MLALAERARVRARSRPWPDELPRPTRRRRRRAVPMRPGGQLEAPAVVVPRARSARSRTRALQALAALQSTHTASVENARHWAAVTATYASRSASAPGREDDRQDVLRDHRSFRPCGRDSVPRRHGSDDLPSRAHRSRPRCAAGGTSIDDRPAPRSRARARAPRPIEAVLAAFECQVPAPRCRVRRNARPAYRPGQRSAGSRSGSRGRSPKLGAPSADL